MLCIDITYTYDTQIYCSLLLFFHQKGDKTGLTLPSCAASAKLQLLRSHARFGFSCCHDHLQDGSSSGPGFYDLARAMASSEDYKRQQFRDRLAHALNGQEDPLVVYDEFSDWITNTYGRRNPSSGLIELLKEATDRFKNVSEYKTNLRYLKLWGKYAGLLSSSEALETYSYLFSNGIGRRYAALYLEFANLLEKAGR